jgi:Domain of unknown function (DUF4349)
MKQLFVVALAAACLATACQNGYRKEQPENTRNEYNQQPAVTEKRADTASNAIPPATRKLAHKAHMELEVADILPVTRRVEERVQQSGGFILQSHSSRRNEKTASEPVSGDSLKKITYYQLQNDMTVRVPDTALLPFLNYTESLGLHTRVRNIDAEDVSLQLTAAQLEAARINRRISRRATAQAETLEAKEAERDAVQLNRLQLTDAVQYSTVVLSFVQPPQVAIQYEVNVDAVWARQPGFFKRAGYAFNEGWASCKNVLVFFVQIWWLFALGGLCWWAWRKWGRPLLAPQARKPV